MCCAIHCFANVHVSSQLNTGTTGSATAGHDINVEPVWLQGITGCNSVIGVVDDGEALYTVDVCYITPFSLYACLLYRGLF